MPWMVRPEINISGVARSNWDMGLAHPGDAYLGAVWRGRHEVSHRNPHVL